MILESRGAHLWVVGSLECRPFEVARHLEAAVVPGRRAVVCGFDSVGIHVESLAVSKSALEAALATFSPPESKIQSTKHIIPVRFDLGLDLPSICSRLGLTREEVVAAFCAAEYEVITLGFSPGFPYLAGLPEALSGLDRLPAARPRVPKGAVAITGNQACIYPSSTAGGWNILGVTDYELVNLETPKFAFSPGDTLRFSAETL